MSQRFVIDVNINGASGSTRSGEKRNTENSANIGLIGAGAAAVKQGFLSNGALIPKTQGGQEGGFAVPYKSEGWYSKKTYKQEGLEEMGYGQYGGKLSNLGTRRSISDIGQEQETLLGFGARKGGDIINNKKIQAGASAIALKTAHTVVEMKNYQSGNSAENQRRNNNMKAAGYALAFAMNPAIGGALIINETFNAVKEGMKYNYDRKLERSYISNSGAVLGDVSYGRSRGIGV